MTNPLVKLAPRNLRLDVESFVGVRMRRCMRFFKDSEGQPMRRGDFSLTHRRQIQAEAKAIFRQRILNGDYPGAIVGSAILIMILGAVISWAIQRWLDRIFPKEK